MSKSSFSYALFASPLGQIGFLFFQGRLSHLFFCETEEALFRQALAQIKMRTGYPPLRNDDLSLNWLDPLNRYFAGENVIFNGPIFLQGTLLQKRIWRAMAEIPYGTTRSYQAIARRLGIPKSARVVGRACAANPIPVIIPCHRVVCQDGSIGGYRGGIPIKKRLLSGEGVRFASKTRKEITHGHL